ncbi:MAG: sulfotransferase, partial [Pleurocapsa sp.]
MVAQIDNLYIKTSLSKTLSRLLSYGLFEGRPLTTKGQWINPLIFKLFAIAKKLPQLKKVRKPIFVIGTGRSGTTILGVVLSMHKQIGF